MEIVSAILYFILTMIVFSLISAGLQHLGLESFFLRIILMLVLMLGYDFLRDFRRDRGWL